MLYWIFVIAFFGGVGYAIYQSYLQAKWSDDEDALQNFWKYVGIGAVFVLLVCAYFGYGYVNHKHRHHRYHNSETGQEQIQYQGSQEQQQDINAIDKYKESHPDF